MAKPFTTKIKIDRWGNGGPGPGEEIEALVDTGAAYTSLPRSLLARLGTPVLGKKALRLADGRRIERDYGPCLVWVVNGWVGTTVLFAEDQDVPLLGTNTMDDASVEVDLANKRLVPVQAVQASILKAAAVAKRLFTIDEYHRMAAAGVLRGDDRVELLEGEIVEMSPIGKEHAVCVKRLNRWFNRNLGGRALVGVQDPIRVGNRSEPQPDLTLLRPRADDYAGGHPGPEDVLLVVEVADTSQAYDRDVKIPFYASAGIPEAWLADIAEKAFEVHRKPGPAGYSEVRRVSRGQSVAPAAFPEVALPVDEIFRGLP